MTRALRIQDRAQLDLPRCGMAMGTRVVTLDGAIPVEFLEVGEHVVTRRGALPLRSIAISVIRNARLVRIGAATLGHEGAGPDVLVPASQRILVRDWRAFAFAGSRQALVAAARLSDGEFIRGEIHDSIRIFALGFDQDTVIHAGGLGLECCAAPAGT